MFITLITGSRDWGDWMWIYDDLDRVAALVHEDNMLVRHGRCPEGADMVADEWSERNQVDLDRMPADWNQYGKRAGFVRNTAMVHKDPKPSICFAYINPCVKPDCKTPGLHGSHGGMMCGELAEKAGIHVVWRKNF